MSRLGPADTVYVKPTNNIYTVLVLVAIVIVGAAIYVMNTRAETVFGLGLLN